MRKALFVFDNTVDPTELSSFCSEMGIDSLILHPGFFENDAFLKTMRDNGLKVWLNLPVFFDEKYLDENPEAYSMTSLGNRAAHSWLHMVCPSQQHFLDRKQKEFGDLLRRVHPDYISYDFMRFYVFWEEVALGNPPEAIEHGCYCAECRRRYKLFSGESISIRDGIIEERQRKSLGEWKRNVIGDAVLALNHVAKDAAKGTPIYIKTIPWKTSDLDQGLHWISGQDTHRLGGLSDGVIPMAFPQILGQTPEWKKELLDHVKAASGKEVMSYIQFEPLIRQTAISNQQLDEEIQAAVDENRAGLVYFHYEQIAGNAGKKEIIRNYRDR